jgi:hypothetical protein
MTPLPSYLSGWGFYNSFKLPFHLIQHFIISSEVYKKDEKQPEKKVDCTFLENTGHTKFCIENGAIVIIADHTFNKSAHTQKRVAVSVT